MIFSELYSAYYNAVADIIKTAIDHQLQKGELRQIVERHAFGESILSIEPAITEEHWQVVKPDGSTPIRHIPTMPLTITEKRWLKAISLDPRIRLFSDELPDHPDVEPLFTPDDHTVFDRYSDGDDYGDEAYIRNFRLILEAIKTQAPISITVDNRKGRMSKKIVIPRSLEYSEKDDKFRMIAAGKPSGGIYNLARIRSCELYKGECKEGEMKELHLKNKEVVFELYDRRKALERVLMHFAHFEKEACRLDENKYKIKIRYEKDDETEMVIRILSFGPMVKVTEPESFVELIKERLIKQKSCGL
ncbi:MAG: WYL domain-containing protein [Lachnospiraceae bacterium]|nr:WYL domain-containing protein [Lachnospiraceae bacterium]